MDSKYLAELCVYVRDEMTICHSVQNKQYYSDGISRGCQNGKTKMPVWHTRCFMDIFLRYIVENEKADWLNQDFFDRKVY